MRPLGNASAGGYDQTSPGPPANRSMARREGDELPGRVFITRPIPEPGSSILRGAADAVGANPEDRALSADELRAAAAGVDALVCLLTDEVDASILEAAPGLRVVATVSVGYNHIDVDAATRLGIAVTNTPGTLTECTADLTWALILGVARRVAEGDRAMRAGAFPGWGMAYMLGGEVHGSTLGLVGPGAIAQAVARRAIGFGMRLLYAGRRASSEMEAIGGERVEFDVLLAESDFVSLHVPLSTETKHLIDAGALSRMKKTAYLINTSRGPVVDEPALVRALQSGTIAGAGLDVYEDEPRAAEGLVDCPNTLLLPHLGSATGATRSAMALKAAENVAAALRGDSPPDLVNPEAWPAARGRPLRSPEVRTP